MAGIQHDHDHARHADDGDPHDAAARASADSGHDHDHDHEAHRHDHFANASEKRLMAALVLLASFTLVEGIGGLWANSIALLAEAAHMLADSASLLLAIIAVRMSRRAADLDKSYGHQRYQTLAAYTNGVALLVLTVWVVVEALHRLWFTQEVNARLMLGIAIAGAVANFCAALVLSGGRTLNERSARAHVLADLLGSGAAIVAACIIWWLGWPPADPLLSIFVSVLIFRSGWALTRESSHVLLQGTPAGFDAARVKQELSTVQGVREVHDLHAWSLTGDAAVVTLHASLVKGAAYQATLVAMLGRLRDRFAVEHATIQIEEGYCADTGGAQHHV